LGANGFVFSNAEINRAIDRNNRLREARKLASEAVLAPRRPSAMAA
jgi:hypothetical protein